MRADVCHNGRKGVELFRAIGTCINMNLSEAILAALLRPLLIRTATYSATSVRLAL